MSEHHAPLVKQGPPPAPRDLRDGQAAALVELLFDQEGLALCLVAPEGTVERANATWLRAVGRTRDQVLGHPITELLPGAPEQTRTLLDRVRAGETVPIPPRFQPLRSPTGWDGDVAPVPTAHGATGLLFRAREVSDAESRHRAFFTHLPQAVTIYDVIRDPRGDIVDWALRDANPEAIRALGVPLEALLGKRASELFGADAMPWHLEASRQTMRTGMARTAEVHLERNQRYYLASMFPLGRDLLATTATDITERVRTERELRESEAWFRAIVDTIPNMIWVAGTDGAEQYENPRLAEYTGLGPEALRGGGWTRVVHPEDLDRVVDVWSRALATGRSFAHALRIRRHDGEYRWFRVAAAALRDGEGRIVRWIGSWTDIHDAKLAEEALRATDRHKNEFLGVLSHELRNPLAPIRNALHILDRAPPGGEEASAARAVIGRQLDHLTGLVDDLLDVTRISRGKIQLHRDAVDLGRAVRRTVDDHRGLFARRGIDVELELEDGAGRVDADPVRLGQIVGNLLQNAAKFTGSGGRVRVSVHRVGEERASVRVEDTGIGIAPELLDHVFEPFTQGDDSLHRSAGGLGLGLALVKGLADLHGGTATARSAGPGRGAEFTVTLPLAKGSARAAVPSPASAGVPPRRVLVIEDNEDAAETLRVLLEMGGHEVAVAHDGREGVARARELRPDVVLCDLGLPELDGFEVARALRADPAFATTTLVAISGYALPEDLRRAADAGFDRHLAKPVPLERIEEVLAGG